MADIPGHTAPPDVSPDAETVETTRSSPRVPLLYRRPRVLGVVAILMLALAVIGIRYWIFARDNETTASAVVEGRDSDIWVVARFKETQLPEIRPGQPARIRVEAYPDTVLRGRVESIQDGSVREVNVVQRVPVKIVFDAPPDADRPLEPGMRVVVTVVVR